jgi:SNF2 family DNA or RNA helicase
MLKALFAQKAKVLLFSYSVKLLDILEKFIKSKGYTFLRLDGNTKTSIRLDLVNEFNQDEKIFIFLISTK